MPPSLLRGRRGSGPVVEIEGSGDPVVQDNDSDSIVDMDDGSGNQVVQDNNSVTGSHASDVEDHFSDPGNDTLQVESDELGDNVMAEEVMAVSGSEGDEECSENEVVSDEFSDNVVAEEVMTVSGSDGDEEYSESDVGSTSETGTGDDDDSFYSTNSVPTAADLEWQPDAADLDESLEKYEDVDVRPQNSEREKRPVKDVIVQPRRSGRTRQPSKKLVYNTLGRPEWKARARRTKK